MKENLWVSNTIADLETAFGHPVCANCAQTIQAKTGLFKTSPKNKTPQN
jgi:hypothetical protein